MGCKSAMLNGRESENTQFHHISHATHQKTWDIDVDVSCCFGASQITQICFVNADADGTPEALFFFHLRFEDCFWHVCLHRQETKSLTRRSLGPSSKMSRL